MTFIKSLPVDRPNGDRLDRRPLVPIPSISLPQIEKQNVYNYFARIQSNFPWVEFDIIFHIVVAVVLNKVLVFKNLAKIFSH